MSGMQSAVVFFETTSRTPILRALQQRRLSDPGPDVLEVMGCDGGPVSAVLSE